MNLFQTPFLVVPTYRKNEHIRNQHIGKYARIMNLLEAIDLILMSLSFVSTLSGAATASWEGPYAEEQCQSALSWHV